MICSNFSKYLRLSMISLVGQKSTNRRVLLLYVTRWSAVTQNFKDAPFFLWYLALDISCSHLDLSPHLRGVRRHQTVSSGYVDQWVYLNRILVYFWSNVLHITSAVFHHGISSQRALNLPSSYLDHHIGIARVHLRRSCFQMTVVSWQSHFCRVIW